MSTPDPFKPTCPTHPDARITSSLADGILGGACSTCNRWIVAKHPVTGAIVPLNGEPPWSLRTPSTGVDVHIRTPRSRLHGLVQAKHYRHGAFILEVFDSDHNKGRGPDLVLRLDVAGLRAILTETVITEGPEPKES